MGEINLAKLLMDSVAALAAVVMAILIFKAWRTASKEATVDREKERAALMSIISNHIHEASEANKEMADALLKVAEAVATCPQKEKVQK